MTVVTFFVIFQFNSISINFGQKPKIVYFSVLKISSSWTLKRAIEKTHIIPKIRLFHKGSGAGIENI